jgi:hypothetical protein
MGCGCKQKNNEPQQPVQNQNITESTTPIATPDVQQEQVIQVAVALREMIENKEL